MNLVVISVPHTHDQQTNSCVNSEVQVCNRKLNKLKKAFNYLSVIEVNDNRDIQHMVHT